MPSVNLCSTEQRLILSLKCVRILGFLFVKDYKKLCFLLVPCQHKSDLPQIGHHVPQNERIVVLQV